MSYPTPRIWFFQKMIYYKFKTKRRKKGSLLSNEKDLPLHFLTNNQKFEFSEAAFCSKFEVTISLCSFIHVLCFFVTESAQFELSSELLHLWNENMETRDARNANSPIRNSVCIFFIFRSYVLVFGHCKIKIKSWPYDIQKPGHKTDKQKRYRPNSG